MPNLSPEWEDYLRLQECSLRTTSVDSYSWGLEEQLNRLLLAETRANQEHVKRRLPLLGETAARRERYRTQILHHHRAEITPQAPDPVKQLEARNTIKRIMAGITARQWAILIAHAQGFDYAHIAQTQNVAVGAARTQISRLRRQLAFLNPAA